MSTLYTNALILTLNHINNTVNNAAIIPKVPILSAIYSNFSCNGLWSSKSILVCFLNYVFSPTLRIIPYAVPSFIIDPETNIENNLLFWSFITSSNIHFWIISLSPVILDSSTFKQWPSYFINKQSVGTWVPYCNLIISPTTNSELFISNSLPFLIII